MNEAFVFEYVAVNDGKWRTYSHEEVARMNAFRAFHDTGAFEWASYTIENLPCDHRDPDDPDSHYPDLCWHYRVTIVPAPSDEPGIVFEAEDGQTVTFE